jgi:hypothetical protein
VERRVTTLRGLAADLRSRARLAATADEADVAALASELDEIGFELSIAEAQLDLDAAHEGEAFVDAVRRQIDASRAYAEVLDDQAPPGTEGSRARSTDGGAIRDYAATALERLQRYRALSTEVSDSLRAGVLAALDDLDRALQQTRPIRDRSHERSHQRSHQQQETGGGS